MNTYEKELMILFSDGHIYFKTNEPSAIKAFKEFKECLKRSQIEPYVPPPKRIELRTNEEDFEVVDWVNF